MPSSGSENDDKFLLEIGYSIREYAKVEGIQADLLKTILGIDRKAARAIFFAIPNVRARVELFQTLLAVSSEERHRKYWESCSAFLQVLAHFRNAIVHWHPVYVLMFHKSRTSLNEAGEEVETQIDPATAQRFGGPGITNPKPDKGGIVIHFEHLPAFNADCLFMIQELHAFDCFLAGKEYGGDTSPDRFQKPIGRRNRAVLQPPPKPKAPKAPPRSSRG